MDSQLLTKFPNLKCHKYLFTCCYMCTDKLMDEERDSFPYLLHRDANIPKNDLKRYNFQQVQTLPIARKVPFYKHLHI